MQFLTSVVKFDSNCITNISQIPRSLCYPYLLARLTTRILETGGLDYVTVFHEEQSFHEFSNLNDPAVERKGYTYEPIDIQG